ncbi:MAG: hypothetical protein J7L53_03545 [Deltaproteobacteria bacterium]|nr:hypothetical protein [Deltaproteobacteria bacterium]
MNKFKIEATPERCTGCLICQLVCSEIYTKRFNPSMARIKVDILGVDCLISFTEECNECGVCVDHCLYGALKKIPREKRK